MLHIIHFLTHGSSRMSSIDVQAEMVEVSNTISLIVKDKVSEEMLAIMERLRGKSFLAILVTLLSICSNH